MIYGPAGTTGHGLLEPLPKAPRSQRIQPSGTRAKGATLLGTCQAQGIF